MITDEKAQRVSEILSQLKVQVEQLLVLLSQKERMVVEKRFSINVDKKHTLEEIGQEFNVTRERVRQIEKNALHKLKRNAENFGIILINDSAHEILRENGGIMKEDLMISRLLEARPETGFEMIQFVLSLDKRFKRVPNTISCHPHVRLTGYDDRMIDMVCETALGLLKRKGDVIDTAKLGSAISEAVPECSAFGLPFFMSLFAIHKSFKQMKDATGLMEWRHIHPRTLRDKIFFILRQKKSPMHFVEIGNLIQSSNFDRKRLNMQAIHNELIRHPDFVLIGRGIYALKEWGFNHGTVAEVIESVLKGKTSMSEDEIIAEVLKNRQVKKITIILNLKNKPRFVRVGRKQYALKKD